MSTQKIGVLLINLGTPDSCEKKDVRKYLSEFLKDKRVIDIPILFRLLLLYLIILPFRTKKSAKAYKSIWFENGSPLMVYSRQLADNVQNIFGKSAHVELCMRYQSPSIKQAVQSCIQKQNVDKIVIFPLFPQYTSAASGSALEKAFQEISEYWNIPTIVTIPPFYNHPQFISCFSNRLLQVTKDFEADHILFSYHGLPERHILKSQCSDNQTCLKNKNCCQSIVADNSNCYRAQCFATTRFIINQANLSHVSHSNSFQSRLGRTKWIEPYTDVVLPELIQQGVKKLVVVCPAFVADCLETLEEISIRAREQWLELGGQDLILVPSLNGEMDWAQSVVNLIKENVYDR